MFARALLSMSVVAASAGMVNANVIFTDDMAGTVSGSGTLYNPDDSNWRGVAHSSGSGTNTNTTSSLSNSLTAEATDPGTNGQRLFLGTASFAAQAMLFTPQAKFDAAVTDSQNIADYVANSWNITYYTRNDAGPTDRLALKVDGTWYVRNDASTSQAVADNWLLKQVTNPFGTSGWTALTFDDANPGDGLSRLVLPLAGTDTLPASGELQGIALWAGRNNNFGIRLDLVTIEATPIPEPASLILLGLGSLVALRRKA